MTETEICYGAIKYGLMLNRLQIMCEFAFTAVLFMTTAFLFAEMLKIVTIRIQSSISNRMRTIS